MKFEYAMPIELTFGRGRVQEAGKIVAAYGKKALLVTGTGSTKRTGLLDRTAAYLKEAGVEVLVFDKVTQNPLTTTAEEGARLCRENGCDVVLGLGGGSIMDCAKAIAFLALNDGDINDYIFNKLQGDAALPIVLIPTTCGTGSEGNAFSVLSNPETGDKKSLKRTAILPKASIIDSELMETMPKGVLASVGFDALCHCMEAYLSKTEHPVSTIMALEGISLLGKNLVSIYEGNGSLEAWDAITWASTMGGMVIYFSGVALPHGMEHPASGLRDIVHGRGLAALTPVITEMSWPHAKEKYAEISKRLGGTGAEDCAQRIYQLLEQLNLRTTLSEQGILPQDIPWMTENCLKVGAANIANHPVAFTKEDIAEIYKRAL